MPSTLQFPVMEQFNTVQGEGFHAGKAAYFIRIAGCDVGCVWCDVKDSWHTEGYPILTIAELVTEVCKYPSEIVIITGGEPAMYDLTELCNALHAANKKVHIETSGAYTLQGNFDWVCFSPKKFKAPVAGFSEQASELKVIIYNKSDFEWAKTFEAEVGRDCELFIQPEWSKHEKVQPLMIDFVKQNPQWRISLQIHKYLGID